MRKFKALFKELFWEWVKPKPIPKRRVIWSLVMICACVALGFIAGFYAGTGILPTFTENKSIAPPEFAKTTLADTQATLRSITLRDYEEGYNCVDFAWDATRALSWQGQPAAIVAVEFIEGPNHALLYVPTTDEGWCFIEPQAGILIRPVVGGIYDGRRITAIRILKMVWIPVDEFSANPVFEEVR